MRKTLTDVVVTRLAPPAVGRLEVLDTITPGFGIRVTPAGTRTYFVLYRVKGDRKQQRLTLGNVGEKSLKEARREAQEAIALAREGGSPKIRREIAVEANKADDAQTERDRFETVARTYIKQYVKPNLKQARPVELMIEKRLIPEWGQRSIHSITRRDLIALLDTIGEVTPIMANRVHARISHLFGWCVERAILESNPAIGMKKPHEERTRDRVLADDEIRLIWNACDVVGYPGGPLARLLLLSACRLNEIAQLTKDQRGENVITLPETKNGRPHLVPISKPMRAALDDLPKFKGAYLLTSTAGERPSQNFADLKAELDKHSGVTGWVFHDLRRTAASCMARLKIAPHVIEAVLNHSSGAVSGIARVYNRYEYLEEKRAALEKWGTEVRRIVAGRAASNVVAMRR